MLEEDFQDYSKDELVARIQYFEDFMQKHWEEVKNDLDINEIHREGSMTTLLALLEEYESIFEKFIYIG